MIIIIPHSYPRKPVEVSLLQNTQICSWYLPFLQQHVSGSQWTFDPCFWAARQLLQLGSWCNRKLSITKAPFCVHPSLYCFHCKTSNRENCCNGGSRKWVWLAAMVDLEFLFQSWCSCQTICQWIFLPSMPINSGSFTICNKIPHKSFGVNLLCIIETPIWCCQGVQTSRLHTPHPTNNFPTTPLRLNPKQR
jgi:hypothetical protein